MVPLIPNRKNFKESVICLELNTSEQRSLFKLKFKINEWEMSLKEPIKKWGKGVREYRLRLLYEDYKCDKPRSERIDAK